jgi:hypothetical protein
MDDGGVVVVLLVMFITASVTWLVAYTAGRNRGFKEGSSTGFRHGYQTAGGKHHA